VLLSEVLFDLLLCTARCDVSAVYAVVVCSYVRLSITSQCYTKTAKPKITQTMPYNSPGPSELGPRDSSFLMLKICAKFQRACPQWVHQTEVG